MNNFSWSRAFGFGVLAWLIMFAATSALVGFKVNMASVWWGLGIAVIAGLTSFILAGYSKIESSNQALGYGAMWVVMGLALDLVISWQFNSSIFTSWEYWVGYALVLIAPWLEYELRGTGVHHPV